MKYTEGWNDETEYLTVLVEEGKVLRGIMNTAYGAQVPVYPYKKNGNVLVNCAGMSLKQYKRNRNKISWFS